MSIDRQRIEAVKLCEAIGYRWSGVEWLCDGSHTTASAYPGAEKLAKHMQFFRFLVELGHDAHPNEWTQNPAAGSAVYYPPDRWTWLIKTAREYLKG